MVISSYIFFALLIFNSLALLSSEFTHLFSQLFYLFSKNKGIYDIFSLILFFISVIILILNAIKNWKIKFIFSKKSILFFLFFNLTFIGISLYFVYSLFVKMLHTESISIEFEEIIYNKNSLLIDMCLGIFTFIFFIILPFLYKFLPLNINSNTKTGMTLLTLKPNITTITLMIAAFGFGTFNLNLNLIFFIISSLLLIIAILKKKINLDFYENINVLILICMILMSLLTMHSITNANFYNAKLTFYSLGFFSYFVSWGNNFNKIAKENL